MKKLDTNIITNELEQSSSFFSQPQKPAIVRPVPPVRVVRPVHPVPVKRIMKSRCPFDIYQDQYESLKQLALDDRMSGGAGSMSAMVREALDKLISSKKKDHV